MAVDEREKMLTATMERIHKRFGEGSAMFGDSASVVDVEVYSSGSLNLDNALGVGGYPKGRVIEVYGPESSGKTTMALSALAGVQASGGICAFVDAEHALDPSWAKRIGVRFDETLIVSQPDSGEQALEIVDEIIRCGAVDLIVVDSVAALVPQAELTGEMSDMQVGLQARLMSKALRKITAELNKSKTSVIFINQLREKIGGMGYGDPTTTTGGRALKFYSSVRIDVRRIGGVKNGESPIGNVVKAKVAKNKVAAPFKTAEFEIMFDEGISRTGELIDLGIHYKVLTKAGSWFSRNGEQLGQGKEKVRELLRDNPELAAEIEAEVRALMNPQDAPEMGEDEPLVEAPLPTATAEV